MSQNLKTPKTPSRRSRSVTKTPLTPSLLAGLNTLNIASPTKSRGKSNGMLTTSKSAAYLPDLPQPKSRQTSPLKRSTSNGMLLSEELQRQANSGAMRRNGPESRMNVITNDYVPPPQMETKRSKSQPVIAHVRVEFTYFVLCQRFFLLSVSACFPESRQPSSWILGIDLSRIGTNRILPIHSSL